MLYTDEFYRQMQRQSHDAAAAVLPILQRHFTIQSAVDFGCGQGVWLAEFIRAGIADIMGVDGNWVRPESLEIPRACFSCADLAKPIQLQRRFDLALCLEVAEHLSAADADQLVASLVSHADVILFSAAIPYQPGTHHVNCQWPAYWADKFSANGFVAYDLFRAELWDMPDLAFHFRQNMLLYVRGSPACRSGPAVSIFGRETQSLGSSGLLHGRCRGDVP